ncbi:hypothetical protein [Xenorhabdus bovienii]|uniref:hypothetical protein n=1 Tax=Xenorhabdus bovienii TaxID=40576 RepID=UPI00056EABDC|nr:hypothetical protein [Xenorhabdus bovienii]
MRNDKIECAKRKCKHIHYENDRIEVPDPEIPTWLISVCPKCGANDFYIIEKLEGDNNEQRCD